MNGASSEKSVAWHVVSVGRHNKPIATIGVMNGELVCVGHHYDFRDLNRDGKVSRGEKIVSLISDDEGPARRDIADFIRTNFDQLGFEAHLAEKNYRNATLDFFSRHATIASNIVKYANFKILVGGQISRVLEAAGVEGIRKLLYKAAIASFLKGVID